MFAAVFLYEVEPAGAQAFEAAYGPDGAWARFFALGDGYAGTELWRGSEGRYLLIDRWSSEAAYAAFLDAHGDEYRRRSDEAEHLYLSEQPLGRFALWNTTDDIRPPDACRDSDRRSPGSPSGTPTMGATMANPVPAGSDVSAGTYRCTNCGYELQVDSTRHLPPCPECSNGEYDTLSGGDSVDDPYP